MSITTYKKLKLTLVYLFSNLPMGYLIFTNKTQVIQFSEAIGLTIIFGFAFITYLYNLHTMNDKLIEEITLIFIGISLIPGLNLITMILLVVMIGLDVIFTTDKYIKTNYVK